MNNLREQILNVVDTETREVEVPEWGVTVWVRSMSAADRDAFEADLLQGKGKNTSVNYRNMRAKLVARCVVDAEGNRIFNPEDVPALGRKSAKALTRLYNVATELSGVSDDDVEELTGNSEPDQSDDSCSDWPGTSA